MKKIMTLLLVAVMLVACMATTAFAYERGDIATVEFTVSGNSDNGFGNCQVSMNYDKSVLEFQKVETTGIATGSLVSGGADQFGVVSIAGVTGNGAIVKVTFKVSDTAAPGTYPVSGTVTMCREADGVTPVALSISGGSVTVTCNHVPGAAVKENVVPETCGVDGSYDEVVYCTVCGGEISRITKTVPATGNHTAGAAIKENVVPATCGADGSYDEVVKCSVCGKELSRVTKTVPATGNHTAGAAVKENVVPATCGADGSYDEVVKCSVCGKELSRVAKTEPATGNHTAGAAVKENVVPATCGADGSYDEVVKCSVCGKELSRTAKTEPATGKHTAGEPVKENVVPHTCTTDGSYDEVVYCSVCKAEISRVTKVDPKDHTPAKAVRENEVKGDCQTKHSYDEVVYCSVCGEELSRTKVVGELGGHNYGTDGKCTICGKVKDPNLDKQPDTGDIFVEIALYASFAALAVGAVVYAKRKVRG